MPDDDDDDSLPSLPSVLFCCSKLERSDSVSQETIGGGNPTAVVSGDDDDERCERGYGGSGTEDAGTFIVALQDGAENGGSMDVSSCAWRRS